jgi:hypothetical protein
MANLKTQFTFFFLLLYAVLPLTAQVNIDLHGSVETIQALPFSKDRGLIDSRNAFTGEINVASGEAAAFVSLSVEYNAVSNDRTGFALGEA